MQLLLHLKISIHASSLQDSLESTCLTSHLLQFAHFLAHYLTGLFSLPHLLSLSLLPLAICIERHLSSLAQLWQLAPSTSDLKDWQLWSLHPLFGLHGLISSWASTTSISLPEPPTWEKRRLFSRFRSLCFHPPEPSVERTCFTERGSIINLKSIKALFSLGLLWGCSGWVSSGQWANDYGFNL